MFHKSVEKAASVVRALEGIRHSDLPRGMRPDVARGIIRMATTRFRKLPNPVFLAGFRISYFDEARIKNLFQEIFVEGAYLFSAKRERPLIIDCGSNIGLSILFFKKSCPNARVIGFEPDPVTFRMLKVNIEQNALRDVEVHQYALSDADGVLEFYIDDNEAGSVFMSTIKERTPSARPITVPACRLSEFITEEVDLLKLDVEGAEMSVLLEIFAADKLRMIDQMHIEYHHHIDGSSDDLSRILKLLEDARFGYQLRAGPMGPRLPVARSFQGVLLYCYRK